MIIGISGKKQAGKDTLGWFIKRSAELDVTVKRRPVKIKKFAYKLKEIISILTGIPQDWLEDDYIKNKPLGSEWDYYEVSAPPCYKRAIFFSELEVKEYVKYHSTELYKPTYTKEQMTPRKMLQILGTEAGRQIVHPNIWINALFADYKERYNWIVTDVRFPNEAQAIKDRGGVLIRIERPSLKADDQHESEIALDNYSGWDHLIINEDEYIESIRGLENEAQKLMKLYL